MTEKIYDVEIKTEKEEDFEEKLAEKAEEYKEQWALNKAYKAQKRKDKRSKKVYELMSNYQNQSEFDFEGYSCIIIGDYTII